jgi:hypothetical protein
MVANERTSFSKTPFSSAEDPGRFGRKYCLNKLQQSATCRHLHAGFLRVSFFDPEN